MVDDEVGPGQDIIAAIGDDDEVAEIGRREKETGFATAFGFSPDNRAGWVGLAAR